MIINNSGGGAALNFSVIGGTSQPSSPAANTIWVNTSTSITSWVFSSTQPSSPSAGMVWFQTSTSSATAFNALKKNNLTAYPNTCKQYVSGAWVVKTAKTYQNGAWKDWDLKIFVSGLGALVSMSYDATANSSYTVSKECIKFAHGSSGSRITGFITDQAYELARYKTLHLNAKCTMHHASYGAKFGVLTSKPSTLLAAFPSSSPAYAQFTQNSTKTEYTLDISSLSDSYYIACMGMSDVEIYDIWLD